MVLALQDNWATHLSIYDHLPQLVPTDPTDSLFERPPLSLTRPARSPLPAPCVAVGATASGTTKRRNTTKTTKPPKPEQAIQRDNRRTYWRLNSQVSAGTALLNVTEITCWLIDLIAAKRVPAPRLRYSWVGAVGAQATP